VPLGITGTDISRNLSRLLGLQGKFSMAQDEVQVPVISVGDLWHSPYQPFTPCGASGLQGAVALENAYVLVRPTAGMFFVVDEVTVSSTSEQEISIARLTAANLVTLGAPFSILAFRNFNATEPAAPTGPRLGPTIELNSFVGVLGDTVAGFLCGLARGVQRYQFPHGYVLDGDDPSGLNALAVVTSGINRPVQASFVCRIFFK